MDLLAILQELGEENLPSPAPEPANLALAPVTESARGPVLQGGKRKYYVTYDVEGKRHRHTKPAGPMSRGEFIAKAQLAHARSQHASLKGQVPLAVEQALDATAVRYFQTLPTFVN